VRRFLALWFALTVTAIGVTAAVSFLAFHNVDLRYEPFVAYVAVPSLQALFLAWATKKPGRASIREIRQATFRHPTVAPVLILDAVLLGTGWVLQSHPILGLGGAISVQPKWIGTKSIAASLFLLAAAVRREGTQDSLPHRPVPTWSERLWIILFALVLAGAGLHAFWPWIEWWPRLVTPGDFASLPSLIRWAIAYGGLFFVAMGLALKTAGLLAIRSPVAGFDVEAATGAAFCAALIVVLNVFLRPYLVEPWHSLALTAGSLAATLLLLGGITAAVPGQATGPKEGIGVK
jgi:hypothetical protein